MPGSADGCFSVEAGKIESPIEPDEEYDLVRSMGTCFVGRDGEFTPALRSKAVYAFVYALSQK